MQGCVCEASWWAFQLALSNSILQQDMRSIPYHKLGCSGAKVAATYTLLFAYSSSAQKGEYTAKGAECTKSEALQKMPL